MQSELFDSELLSLASMKVRSVDLMYLSMTRNWIFFFFLWTEGHLLFSERRQSCLWNRWRCVEHFQLGRVGELEWQVSWSSHVDWLYAANIWRHRLHWLIGWHHKVTTKPILNKLSSCPRGSVPNKHRVWGTKQNIIFIPIKSFQGRQYSSESPSGSCWWARRLPSWKPEQISLWTLPGQLLAWPKRQVLGYQGLTQHQSWRFKKGQKRKN